MTASLYQLVLRSRTGKRTRLTSKGIRWSLYRVVGLKGVRDRPTGFMPNYRRPVKDLGEGFTQERVLSEMNAGNCFDFDCGLREKYTLRLQGRVERRAAKYFVLMYQEGQWRAMEHGISHNALLKNIGSGTAHWDAVGPH